MGVAEEGVEMPCMKPESGKEIFQGHFRLDVVAGGRIGDAVRGDEGEVDGFPGFCG